MSASRSAAARRERIFRRGSIAAAVRASCSLPGVFGRPVADDDDDVLETANDHVADVLQAMLDDLLRDHPPWPRAVR